jgi:hypothetical protein
MTKPNEYKVPAGWSRLRAGETVRRTDATSCRFHGEHWGPAMGLDIGREAVRGGYLYGSAGDFLVVAIRKTKKVISYPKGFRVPYGWEKLTGRAQAKLGMFCRLAGRKYVSCWEPVKEWEGCTSADIGKYKWIVIRKIKKEK